MSRTRLDTFERCCMTVGSYLVVVAVGVVIWFILQLFGVDLFG